MITKRIYSAIIGIIFLFVLPIYGNDYIEMNHIAGWENGTFGYRSYELDSILIDHIYEMTISQYFWDEIGRASVGKECRSRWSPYH